MRLYFFVPLFYNTYVEIFFRGFRMIGHGELAIIVLVVLVLFGASAIPKFARSLGQAKKEFSNAMKEGDEEAAPLEDKNEKKV